MPGKREPFFSDLWGGLATVVFVLAVIGAPLLIIAFLNPWWLLTLPIIYIALAAITMSIGDKMRFARKARLANEVKAALEKEGLSAEYNLRWRQVLEIDMEEALHLASIGKLRDWRPSKRLYFLGPPARHYDS